MNRLAHTLGAAIGGVLATVVLSMAVAFADDYTFVPDPSAPLEVTGINGMPPWYEDVLGHQLFDVEDVTPANPVLAGKFGGDVSDVTTSFGFSNEEILVTNSVGIVSPPVGSVLDTFNFGNGFENVYTDLVGEGPNGTNLITDMFDTPFGDFAIPTTFDAADLTMGDVFITP